MHEEFIAEITFILVLKPENDFSMHWPPDCLAILARARADSFSTVVHNNSGPEWLVT